MTLNNCEISMISSKVWSVLRDIKRIYKFKFVLVGDFAQLDPVEEKNISYYIAKCLQNYVMDKC